MLEAKLQTLLRCCKHRLHTPSVWSCSVSAWRVKSL